MTTPLTYTDSEQAVRLWLRGITSVTALARIDFGAGTDYDPATDGALIVISQVGGTPDAYTPLDVPLISFACWGAKKKTAADVKTALLGALHSLTRTVTDAGVLLDATVTTALYAPDDTGTPRYVVDALVTVRPV